MSKTVKYILSKLYDRHYDRIVSLYGTFARHWPREMGFRLKSGRFTRNVYVPDAVAIPPEEQAVNLVRFHEWTDCFMSVNSFRSEEDPSKPPPYEEGKMWPRKCAYVDRLFFDLDFKENPDVALKETKKLVEYFSKKGCTPLVLFTGRKGFQVHVPFTPLHLAPLLEEAKTTLREPREEAIYQAAKNGLRLLYEMIMETLDLKTLDLATATFERLGRLPFTINSGSGNACVPVSLNRLREVKSVSEIVEDTLEGKVEFTSMNYTKEFGKRVRNLVYASISNEIVETINSLKEAERMRMNEIAKSTLDERKVSTRLDLREPFTAYVVAKWKVTNLLLKKYGKRLPAYVPERVVRYVNTLKKYGDLKSSGYVVKLHSRSKFVASHNFKPGAIEVAARVHLVCLLLKIGFRKDEIHEIFKHARNYNYKITDYHITYNVRRMVADGQLVPEVYERVSKMGVRELKKFLSATTTSR